MTALRLPRVRFLAVYRRNEPIRCTNMFVMLWDVRRLYRRFWIERVSCPPTTHHGTTYGSVHHSLQAHLLPCPHVIDFAPAERKVLLCRLAFVH